VKCAQLRSCGLRTKCISALDLELADSEYGRNIGKAISLVGASFTKWRINMRP
jgi:hypothetical protein